MTEHKNAASPSNPESVDVTGIDEWNRAPIKSATPGGEFVVQAIETYNWLRLTHSAEELETLQEEARSIIKEERDESADDRKQREEFLEKVRLAAQKNGDLTGDAAVAAVRALLFSPEANGESSLANESAD